MVPMTAQRFVEKAWHHNADAITLDLEDGVPPAHKGEVRSSLKEAIALAGGGGAEVFVRVNKPYLAADLAAAAWPGLTGIMLPKIESGAEVAEAATLMTDLERQRGIEVGDAGVDRFARVRAGGVEYSRHRHRQSARDAGGVGGKRSVPKSWHYRYREEDPLVYARGRVVIEGIAAGVQPIGMAFPLSLTPRLLPEKDLLHLATMARNLGFKGAICPHPSWIEPVNAAFSPTAEQVSYYTKVREVFAEGVARGTAAVPLDGKMVDVPVDEWAKVVLHSGGVVYSP